MNRTDRPLSCRCFQQCECGSTWIQLCPHCHQYTQTWKWISVKDKKPKFGIGNRYLFVNGKGEVTYGYAYNDEEGGSGKCQTYSDETIWINDMERETNEVATHWMPLPSKPY